MEDVHSSHRLRVARDWQPRQELDQLCDWWRTPAFGVCLLEGMPGCGKTAIVDRFMRVLPGGYPQLPDVTKEDLPPANGTFVFSFFDGSEDVFFASLAGWLTNHALDSRPASYGFPKRGPRLRYTRRFTHVLPAVDVLAAKRKLPSRQAAPRARWSGSGAGRIPRRGSVGRIVDIPLKKLVLDIADGRLGIAAVITSRYPLVDVVAARSRYLHQIGVGELSPEACCNLLRARGMRGSEERLTALSREHGFHALSLDLLGGYVAEYCSGELKVCPTASMGSPPSRARARSSPWSNVIGARFQRQTRRISPTPEVMPVPDGCISHSPRTAVSAQRSIRLRQEATVGRLTRQAKRRRAAGQTQRPRADALDPGIGRPRRDSIQRPSRNT